MDSSTDSGEYNVVLETSAEIDKDADETLTGIYLFYLPTQVILW